MEIQISSSLKRVDFKMSSEEWILFCFGHKVPSVIETKVFVWRYLFHAGPTILKIKENTLETG